VKPDYAHLGSPTAVPRAAEAVRAGGHYVAAMDAAAYTALGLYSGAGGLDLGFSRAGFQMLWANDSDPFACQTYAANIGEHIVCGDVVRTPPPDDLEPDLIIGGPPCQGFSVAGRMDPSDARSEHVFHFLEVVERFEPRAFVMENVKALAANPRWSAIREALLERAETLGYNTRLYLLNAADFDVPQARERMFLIGFRDAEPRRPVAVTAGSPPTVRRALLSLPAYGQPGNNTGCNAKVIPAANPVMRPTAHKGSLLFNGSGRPLELDGPAKTLPASMGGNATPIVDQEELERAAAPWVVDYHRRLQAGGRPLKRTPARMRRITVEEAAALQTFPSGYCFKGRRVAQYRQVGNAVPPNLAYHVGLAVLGALESVDAKAGTLIAA
jgi:DNA (cytosine-5)-methyltransferase 1